MTGRVVAVSNEASDGRRLAVRVRGQVQGVGFRPFVHRLAGELELSGWVRNDAGGVALEVQGAPERVEAFLRRLRDDPPPLARVDGIEWIECPWSPGEAGFRIQESAGGAATTAVTPDTAVCPACLEELFDPGDRRYRYPFINCTHCGPRYTLTTALPYDRASTTMAAFTQCPACEAEYRDPGDRRFHAQPNACPECGPALQLLDSRGGPLPAADPIAEAVTRLLHGEIVAIKGLGGFHLFCDARNPDTVARLRERKGRDEKPFAVMAAHPRALDGLAHLDEATRHLLESRRRPIVLLRRVGVGVGAGGLPAWDFSGAAVRSRIRPEGRSHGSERRPCAQGGALGRSRRRTAKAQRVPRRESPRPDADAGTGTHLTGIAPGLPYLGAILPYTPLHHLLFHEAAGRPPGTAWLQDEDTPCHLFVCTSANPGGEPLVTGNDEAVDRLGGIADAVLLHDREIHVRCDDSVVRATAGGPVFLRRGRGYTPEAIRLPRSGPPVLATGAFLKNAACVTRGDEAFLSQHVGDLDRPTTCRALDETVDHLMRVLRIRPEAVACDLHPDFYSTALAGRLAEQWSVPLIPVQHHHAHVAAVAAEHGVDGPVLGLALDGVGLGADGLPWGGELLWVDGVDFQRLGHLHPLPLPGGDRAAREPWRMGAAALHVLDRGDEIPRRYAADGDAEGLRWLLERGVRCPATTSLGRLFDAAAGLLGVQPRAGYEGQTPMVLEGLAAAHGPAAPLAGGWRLDGGVLDFRPLLAAVADADPGDAPRAAALFHATVAAGLAQWAVAAASRAGVRTVAAGGGCCLNGIVMEALEGRLAGAGLALLQAHRAPPNDGGLSLGQAWVAIQSSVLKSG